MIGIQSRRKCSYPSSVFGSFPRIPAHKLVTVAMRKKATGAKEETLGDRIRRYRLAKGLTQVRFGELVGIAQRTVTYYELKGTSPPPAILVKMADVLEVSTDLLLGRKKVAAPGKGHIEKPTDVRRLRHLQRLEALPLNDRKALFRIIDALSERSSKRRGSAGKQE